MAHKTAYQCLMCSKPVTHADSIVLSVPGCPKVLIHRGRCYSRYRSSLRHGAAKTVKAPRLLDNVATNVVVPVTSAPTEPSKLVVTNVVSTEKSDSDSQSLTQDTVSVPALQTETGNITLSTPQDTTLNTTTTLHFPSLFSRRVYEYRVSNKLSQSALSKIVGYNTGASSICKLEKYGCIRPTEPVYNLGVLLGMLRHEVDDMIKEKDVYIPGSSTIVPIVYTSSAKFSSDKELSVKDNRCNDLDTTDPYQAARAACKALVLHILSLPDLPDLRLIRRLVLVGWGLPQGAVARENLPLEGVKGEPHAH